MKTRPSQLIALLSLLQIAAPRAHALQEYYAVPDSASSPWSTWSTTQEPGGIGWRTYDSFSIAGDAHITQVSWTGVYIDETPGAGAPPPAQTTTWRFGFFADSSGQPGTVVHTVDVPAANVTSVLVSSEVWENGNPLERRRYTANLPTPAVLSAGVTYWFSPLSLQPNYNPHFSWWMGTASGDCFQHGSQPPTDHIRPSNRAFVLRGDPPPPGFTLSIGGNVIASGGSYVVGNVPLHATQGVVVRVRNDGDTALTGVTATMTAGAPEFSIGTAPPASIAAGGEQNLVFNFTPQATGTFTGTLQVTSSNGTPSPYLIQLSGGGVDNVAPVITTPAAFLSVVDGAAGISAAVNAWLANHGGAAATDNSGTVNWSHDYSGLPAVGASVVVTFTASDPSGNSSTTQANLNLLDETPPTITSPAMDLTVNCTAADRVAMVNAWLAANGTAAATDNGGAFTWSNNFTTLPAACGVQTITFTAEDASGNESTTSAVLTVVDTTAPVISVPAVSTTVESNGSGNTVQRNAWLSSRGGAEAADSCSGVSWTNNFTSLANNLPQTVPVIFTVTDACGNSSTTTADFIIQDTTSPALTTPATDFYGDHANAAASIATFLNTRSGAQATDIAGPVTWSNNYDGTPPPVGGYDTVTFTATDTVGLSVSTTCRLFLFPPGKVWIGPATGAWSTSTHWHGTGGDHYVDLFDFQNSSTSLNVGTTLDSLHIGAGDEVVLSNGADLTVTGGLISNAGNLRLRALNDGLGYTQQIFLSGPTSLEGPGKVFLSGPDRQAFSFTSGTAATAILTVGEGQEITTTAGTVANYQRTAINTGLINNGTVTADAGGMTFYSQPKTNNALMRSINGGFLDIEVPVDNTNGTLFAGVGSTLHLESTATGGTIAGTGRLLVDTGAGLTGPMLLDSGFTTALDGGTTTLTGTITNNGLITFGAAASTATSYIRVNGPVTLDGSGRVLIQNLGRRQLLANTNAATDILTIGAQQEITTDALTDSNYQSSSLHARIVNHGTITADGGQLSLYSQPKTNHNVMRAINGGFLNLQADVDNTNGTLFAGPGSILYPQATITGGTITGTGTLLMNANAGLAGPMLLDNSLTTNLDGAGLWLTGNITHNGIIHFGSDISTSTAYMYVNGAVTLDGNGKIILRNDGRRQLLRANGAATDVLTVGPGIEITTDNRTGLNYQSSALHAPMIINGTVTANGGGLTIYSGAKTNNGTMRALNGGYMDFVSVTVTNYNATTDTLTGGRWEVVTDGPVTTMDLSSSPITTIAANTYVCLSGANATFPQLSTLTTVAGTLCLENGKSFTTAGNLTVTGTLEFGLTDGSVNGFDAGRIVINGNADFSGATIHIRDRGITAGIYEIARWTGTVTGNPVLGDLPQGLNYGLVLDTETKTLHLQVVDNLPKILAIHHDATSNTSTIDYQSVTGVIHQVRGTTDFLNFDNLPDTAIGTGAVLQYLHQPAGNPDRYFYQFSSPLP